MKPRACELCSANATVFCQSDNAYLCHTCDTKVHNANFLVARHIRQPVCVEEEEEEIASDNESSACTTKEKTRVKSFDSATSQRKLLGNYEAEGIFVNWCVKLGVVGDDEVVVRAACGGLRVCLDKWKFLPFRVGLAASMWLGLRVGGVADLNVLKRLERVSGVPSKVILAAESKLAPVSRVERRSRVEMEEGWAEC